MAMLAPDRSGQEDIESHTFASHVVPGYRHLVTRDSEGPWRVSPADFSTLDRDLTVDESRLYIEEITDVTHFAMTLNASAQERSRASTTRSWNVPAWAEAATFNAQDSEAIFTTAENADAYIQRIDTIDPADQQQRTRSLDLIITFGEESMFIDIVRETSDRIDGQMERLIRQLADLRLLLPVILGKESAAE